MHSAICAYEATASHRTWGQASPGMGKHFLRAWLQPALDQATANMEKMRPIGSREEEPVAWLSWWPASSLQKVTPAAVEHALRGVTKRTPRRGCTRRTSGEGKLSEWCVGQLKGRHMNAPIDPLILPEDLPKPPFNLKYSRKHIWDMRRRGVVPATAATVAWPHRLADFRHPRLDEGAATRGTRVKTGHAGVHATAIPSSAPKKKRGRPRKLSHVERARAAARKHKLRTK